MANKCPKCGNILNEFDIFCSRCGTKIEQIDEDILIRENEDKKEDKVPQDELLNKSMAFFLNNNNKSTSKNNILTSYRPKFFTNEALTYCMFIITIFLLFGITISLFIAKQTTIREKLKFKNYMTNVALIPTLKESKTYSELNKNFSDVEDFLYLYLKYSNDDNSQKEQIFIGFLNELDKLPHLTSENITSTDIRECNNIVSSADAQKCSKKLNKKLKKVGISSLSDRNIVYLYPNNSFMNKKYSKFLSKDTKEYLKLKSKYNTPVSNNLTILIPPKKIAQKLADFEIFLSNTTNSDIKEDVEKILYNDTRKFIFSPEIYATTTQEMRKDFKNAYKYYIDKKRFSSLRPLIMSYYEKQKSYSEENFKNDYPYKSFKYSLEENISNSTFSDIFSSLRIGLKQVNDSLSFKYVYNSTLNNFKEYNSENVLEENEFILSQIDENNNIAVYTNSLSPFQEINVPKGSKLFLVNSKLYIFNKNKLNIYGFNFNGRTFNTYTINHNDISSIFPGVEIINIDSFPNYNAYIEKANKEAYYIVLSKYSQGWDSYVLTATNGQIQPMLLDNMFKVSTMEDVEITFHSSEINREETSEAAPTYKFIIHTKGQAPSNNLNSDAIINEKNETPITTNDKDFEQEQTTPKMMPKIQQDNPSDATLAPPPSQTLEPPDDKND